MNGLQGTINFFAVAAHSGGQGGYFSQHLVIITFVVSPFSNKIQKTIPSIGGENAADDARLTKPFSAIFIIYE